MSKYWVYYSSLDFDARIVVDEDGDFSADDLKAEYRGPFSTLKEARSYGASLANGDIDQYKMMRDTMKFDKPKPF